MHHHYLRGRGASPGGSVDARSDGVRGVVTDWNAVSDQSLPCKQRLDEIGPVNLVAIEEYEETEQRYKFLNTQYEDLVQAKEQLMDVINRINTQTREMFVETFNKIRENFLVIVHRGLWRRPRPT